MRPGGDGVPCWPMKPSATLRLLPRLAVALSLSGAVALAYVTDSSLRVPPDYATFLPPVLGGSYTDPVFGTPVKRISDARNTPDDAGGSGTLTFVTDEYSTMTPFNSDSTRLVLQHESYFGLHDGEGNFIKNLPFEINASAEPRWSRREPTLLYYLAGNQLKQHDVSTEVTTVVHTFSEYSRIRGNGESDICFDGDHFVLAGDGREVFV